MEDKNNGKSKIKLGYNIFNAVLFLILVLALIRSILGFISTIGVLIGLGFIGYYFYNKNTQQKKYPTKEDSSNENEST